LPERSGGFSIFEFWPAMSYILSCPATLIDKAMSGEIVTITRHGTAVAELVSRRSEAHPVTSSDVALLESLRVVPKQRQTVSSAALVRAIRDETEARLFGH
jgi:antitoxin (DNA-binding transcriptional repressor) of toxin-antitoxin stability system